MTATSWQGHLTEVLVTSSHSVVIRARQTVLDVMPFAALLSILVIVAGKWKENLFLFLFSGESYVATVASSVFHQVGLKAESFISSTVLHLFISLCYCLISPPLLFGRVSHRSV